MPSLPNGYRPHLDGIRTLAVYLVVLFHSGVDRASGGFIGVDVFFVLSGYLVTGLLTRDLRERGRIDLKRFYSRRIRRLLPAALVVLIATMIVFSAVASPAEVLGARGSVRAAALYFANWFFISESSDYFAPPLESSPVLHFWSLSIEEQFYATWPLLLLVLHAATRRARWSKIGALRFVVAIGMCASLAAAVWVARTDVQRAYYGTDTRAYQLLAGALIALSPGVIERLRRGSSRRPLGLATAASALGIVLLGSSVVTVGPISRGVVTTALAVTLITSLEAGGFRSVAGRILSLPPVTYLGRISYGTYLWHWLVIIVTTRLVDATPRSTALVAVVVASALAAISYEVVERPLRESRPLNRRVGVVLAGVSLSVVVAVVAVPTLLAEGTSRAEVSVVQGTAIVGTTRVPADLDWRGAQADVAAFPRCGAAEPDECTLVRGDRGAPHVLLVGDSHARMYIPTMAAVAERLGYTFSADVAPACPWQLGLQYLQDPAGCRSHQAELYGDVLRQLDPDVVVVANRTFDEPTSPIHVIDEALGEELPLGSPAYLERIEARTRAALGTLASEEREVLIIEPIPVAPLGLDPLDCLSGAAFVDECRFVAPRDPTPVEKLYRVAAERDDHVWAIDLDSRVCPYLPICDPIVGGLIVRRDTSHLTTQFALTLTEPIGQLLTTMSSAG